MNATFRTDAGTTFLVSAGPEALPPGAIPGNIYAVEGRVMLSMVALNNSNAMQSPLKKSEARAIASALMGAAAEL